MKAGENFQEARSAPSYHDVSADKLGVVSGELADIRSAHVYALISYYIVLLVVAAGLLFLTIVDEKATGPSLLMIIGFLSSGAIAGSVLYQIRMFFRYYIKKGEFDPRWLPKYITAPWEAVLLSIAVLSLIDGGGIVMGGPGFTVTGGHSFAAFGLGALIGFGIREVLGWLGNLAKTMFPSE